MEKEQDKDLIQFLLQRYQIERKKFDRSGIYGYTQRLLAYNSNKIEGSTRLAALFDKEQRFFREKCSYFY